MIAQAIPLNVLTEARDALDAFRTLRTFPTPSQAQLFALQRRAAHAQGALNYWIRQSQDAVRVEVA